jgi:hypothetical protein
LDWKVFGEAIRAFYGLKDKGNAAAKGKEQPVQKDAPQSSESPLLAKVRERLEEAGITEDEFLTVLRFAKLPEVGETGDLLSVPEKVLNLALTNWSMVQEIVSEIREQKLSGEVR